MDKVSRRTQVINKELLENWAIGEKELEQIIVLARDIIDSKTTLLLAKTSARTALFDNELTVFQNAQVSDSPTDMDKWLALVVGNLLHDDVPENRDFFNGRLEFPEHLFEMIKGWNYSMDDSAPEWTKKYFKGIQMFQDFSINMNSLRLNSLNFSYSRLCNITAIHSNLSYTNFTKSIFNKVTLRFSKINGSSFENIEIEENKVINNFEEKIGLDLSMVTIYQYVFMPYKLVNHICNMSMDSITGFSNLGAEKTFLSNSTFNYNSLFDTLKGLFIYGLKNNLFNIKEIKSWFVYFTDKDREEFEKLIDGLGEFKVQ